MIDLISNFGKLGQRDLNKINYAQICKKRSSNKPVIIPGLTSN